MHPPTKQVLRVVRLAGGVALLMMGAILLVVPGPGVPVLLGGLVLLETEFRWARELRARLHRLARRAVSAPGRTRDR